MGRSSAFAQYTGPSTSSRKRAATSEAVQPGTRDRDPMEEDNGTGGSGMTAGEGMATGGRGSGSAAGGGGSCGPAQGRSKAAAQREWSRAAAAVRNGTGAGVQALVGWRSADAEVSVASMGLSGCGVGASHPVTQPPRYSLVRE